MAIIDSCNSQKNEMSHNSVRCRIHYLYVWLFDGNRRRWIHFTIKKVNFLEKATSNIWKPFAVSSAYLHEYSCYKICVLTKESRKDNPNLCQQTMASLAYSRLWIAQGAWIPEKEETHGKWAWERQKRQVTITHRSAVGRRRTDQVDHLDRLSFHPRSPFSRAFVTSTNFVQC